MGEDLKPFQMLSVHMARENNHGYRDIVSVCVVSEKPKAGTMTELHRRAKEIFANHQLTLLSTRRYVERNKIKFVVRSPIKAEYFVVLDSASIFTYRKKPIDASARLNIWKKQSGFDTVFIKWNTSEDLLLVTQMTMSIWKSKDEFITVQYDK